MDRRLVGVFCLCLVGVSSLVVRSVESRWSARLMRRQASMLEEMLSKNDDELVIDFGGDQEAMRCFKKYERIELESASTSYIRTSAKGKTQIVLLHGFDSSALEFRRLLPELESRDIPAFAFDLLDSGFSTAFKEISVASKRDQIFEFIQFAQKESQAENTLLLGASLGGAAAVDFAINSVHPSSLSLALVSPQVTIDGTPKLSPSFAAVGVKVLKSWPLRWIANQLAYADTKTYATSAAIAVGRIHTYRFDWEQNAVQWLLSGGYDSITSDFARLSSSDLKGPKINFFWGNNDKILPPYPDTIPAIKKQCPQASYTFYDNCGHVPHLEQPVAFAHDLTQEILNSPSHSNTNKN